jgi:hypothetical protein
MTGMNCKSSLSMDLREGNGMLELAHAVDRQTAQPVYVFKLGLSL